MTHGHFVVRAEGYPTHHVYTYHTGQLADLLDDLMTLPFLLFWRSAAYAHAVAADVERERRFLVAPYFMQIVLSDILHPEDNLRDVDPYRYADPEEVEDFFRSDGTSHLHPSKIATWMTAMWDNKWHVVWKKSQVSYAREPDVEVRLTDCGYTIRPAPGLEDKRSFDACTPKILVEKLGRLQNHLPEEARVNIWGGKVTVPFHDILVHLTADYVKNRRWETKEKEHEHNPYAPTPKAPDAEG